MTYRYTDPDGHEITTTPDRGWHDEPVITIRVRGEFATVPVRIPADRVEELIAGIRDTILDSQPAPAGATQATDEPSLYEKITAMFSGPLPPPGDVQPAVALPCSTAQLRRQPHDPHRWEPQPGMRPVQCPGYARVPAGTEGTETPPPPDAYRELLARLDVERAKMLRCASHARETEVQRVQEGTAAGLRIAAAHAITLFEGHQAREAYLAGEPAAPHQPAAAE